MFIISKTIFNYKKLNCVLHFNNDQLPPPRANNIKIFYAIKTKWSIRIYCQARTLTVFTHIEGEELILKIF